MMTTSSDLAQAMHRHSIMEGASATRPRAGTSFRRGVGLIAAVSAASVIVVGCAASEPSQTDAAAEPTDAASQLADASDEPPTLAEALEAHAAGDVQRGIDLFLAVVETGDPAQLILNPITEAEFAARHIQLPERAAASMHERILDEVMVARLLTRAVLETGDAAMEADRLAEATRYYEAVRDFARANDQPESLKGHPDHRGGDRSRRRGSARRTQSEPTRSQIMISRCGALFFGTSCASPSTPTPNSRSVISR